MTQMPLPLAYRAAVGERDFFVSEANAVAVRHLDAPPPVTLLTGPEGAGKSHLARLFAAATGGRVCDDLDTAPRDEEALFHAWNAARPDAPLLLVARKPPRDWPVALPDLASRLAATPTVSIAPPDDALLGAVILKRFRDRGVSVGADVVAYLVSRIERSFAAAAQTVEALDAAALAERRPVTVPLARSVLEAQPGLF
jgi:chromosomal replication initiation ATPase DnaA